MKLKSIEKEAADCLKAFKNFKVGGMVVHCHHEELVEKLSEPANNRINYILMSKPPGEQARRLREFRPVLGSLPDELNKARAEWGKAYAELAKAYAELGKARAELGKAYGPHYVRLCPDSPWDGKTIFAGTFAR